MKILILNWRDIKHPQSGGAEILIYEMAKRWVKWGHQVTQFSASFPGGKTEEVIDGVKIIRWGSAKIPSFHIPVHLTAFWWYKKNGKGKFDVVIDKIHGIPFFTPFYVKEKKIALICEVAEEIWDQMFSFPWNCIGRLIEKFYLKTYQNIFFLTISSSTKIDLVKSGISKDKIQVLPMGVSLTSIPQTIKKEKLPTLIFAGRLCQMKGIEDGIKAFGMIRDKIPQSQLWIVGAGERNYVNKLKNYVKKLKLSESVSFFGFVSEEKKFALMKRAHILIHPSRREGWGLVVIEANAVGTPAVAYNAPGLRDSIRNGETGLLTQKNTFQFLTKDVLKLLKDKNLYKKLQNNTLAWSKNFTWEKSAKESLELIEKIMKSECEIVK